MEMNEEVMYCRNCGKLIWANEMRYRKFAELEEGETAMYFLCEECNITEKLMIALDVGPSTPTKTKKKKK